MTKEKWQEIKAGIKEKFGIEDEYEEDLEPGFAEVVEFNGPNGSMLARFVTKPKMLDKKTSFSNRAGSDVKVDYVFSDKEFVSYLEIYNWSEDKEEWQKLESADLFQR